MNFYSKYPILFYIFFGCIFYDIQLSLQDSFNESIATSQNTTSFPTTIYQNATQSIGPTTLLDIVQLTVYPSTSIKDINTFISTNSYAAIYFTPGRYTMEDCIYVNSKALLLYGYGATLVRSFESQTYLIDVVDFASLNLNVKVQDVMPATVQNIRIEGFLLDGFNFNANNPNASGSACINIERTKNVSLLNLNIWNCSIGISFSRLATEFQEVNVIYHTIVKPQTKQINDNPAKAIETNNNKLYMVAISSFIIASLFVVLVVFAVYSYRKKVIQKQIAFSYITSDTAVSS